MAGICKRLCMIGLLCVSCLGAAGCTVTRLDSGEEQKLEFTVVRKEEIPRELKMTIEEKKEKPFELTYTDKGEMYIARGYGIKKTSGYSIQVTDVYKTENAVHIRTELTGPGEKEKVVKKTTWPYVVIRLDYYGSHVVFEE